MTEKFWDIFPNKMKYKSLKKFANRTATQKKSIKRASGGYKKITLKDFGELESNSMIL